MRVSGGTFHCSFDVEARNAAENVDERDSNSGGAFRLSLFFL